jgi:predicted O-methyltransferase YrrM
MGHSMLIMLTSNPKLKITGLEIDNRFAPKAVNYLKKKFTNSKLELILGDSIENLEKIRSDYDLYHIDGYHNPLKI